MQTRPLVLTGLLVRQYVGHMREGHARVRMEEVEWHLDETRFAWIGESSPDSVFYYRIHSPVILIEFDHQTPVAMRGPRPPRASTSTAWSARRMQ
jgi:hypothetical protein